MVEWKSSKIVGVVAGAVAIVSIGITVWNLYRRFGLTEREISQIKEVQRIVEEEMQKVYPEPKPKVIPEK